LLVIRSIVDFGCFGIPELLWSFCPSHSPLSRLSSIFRNSLEPACSRVFGYEESQEKLGASDKLGSVHFSTIRLPPVRRLVCMRARLAKYCLKCGDCTASSNLSIQRDESLLFYGA
jgi:hypothetical protein